jgi:hypothetical protein
VNPLDWLPAVLLGWPAILTALVLCVAGIVRARAKWLVAAAVLITPISLYLAATPRLQWIALLIPLLLVGASIALHRSQQWLTWALFIPFVGVFGWLAVIVTSQ